MFSFLFEKYFHVHLCTWAFCTLCTQNALTYVGMWLCVWNVNRWQKHSVAWYGIARHGMSWYWIAIFFARPLLYVSLNSLNKTTLMIMGAREHTFSLLWQALFPTFLSILFFFLFGQLLYYMGLIQYSKRICMFFTEQHTRAHARSQYHRIIFEVALFLKWKENSIKDDHSIGRIKQVIFIFIKVVSTQQMCTNHAHTKILFQRRKKREREKKS